MPYPFLDIDGTSVPDSEQIPVTLDIESDGIADVRLGFASAQDILFGDMDSDGVADDVQYTARYAVANTRLQHAWRVFVIVDLNGDKIVNSAWFGE